MLIYFKKYWYIYVYFQGRMCRNFSFEWQRWRLRGAFWKTWKMEFPPALDIAIASVRHRTFRKNHWPQVCLWLNTENKWLIPTGSDRAILEETATRETKKSCCWWKWVEGRADLDTDCVLSWFAEMMKNDLLRSSQGKCHLWCIISLCNCHVLWHYLEFQVTIPWKLRDCCKIVVKQM